MSFFLAEQHFLLRSTTTSRDRFFTKTKLMLELSLANHHKKSVIMCHSMGGNLVYYFMKWVESPKGGGGGPTWVDKHIHAVVTLGTPYLGVPKAISTILSAEMKDTGIVFPLPLLTCVVLVEPITLCQSSITSADQLPPRICVHESGFVEPISVVPQWCHVTAQRGQCSVGFKIVST